MAMRCSARAVLAAISKRTAPGRSDIAAAEQAEGIQNFSSQYWLSRCFRDKDLESRYIQCVFAGHMMLMRVLAIVMLASYVILIIDVLSGWGKFGSTSSDLAQYYVPASMTVVALGFMSTRFYSWRTYPASLMVFGVSAMVLHVAPSGVFGAFLGFSVDQYHNVSVSSVSTDGHHSDQVPRKLVELSCWYISKAVFYMLVVVALSPQLLVGVMVFVVVQALYYLKARHEWQLYFGYHDDLLGTNLALSGSVSIGIIWIVDYVRRRQFVLITLLQRSTAARIEQLDEEKERLDYERVFAEQTLHRQLRRGQREIAAASQPDAHEDGGEGAITVGAAFRAFTADSSTCGSCSELGCIADLVEAGACTGAGESALGSAVAAGMSAGGGMACLPEAATECSGLPTMPLPPSAGRVEILPAAGPAPWSKRPLWRRVAQRRAARSEGSSTGSTTDCSEVGCSIEEIDAFVSPERDAALTQTLEAMGLPIADGRRVHVRFKT